MVKLNGNNLQKIFLTLFYVFVCSPPCSSRLFLPFTFMLSNSDYTSATVCFNKTYLAFRFSLMNYLYRYDLHVLPYRLLIHNK